IEWIHERVAQLQIELVGAGSGLVSAPVPVTIGLKQDQPPRASLSYSGVRQRITPQARIPLSMQARDDYGVVAASLSVRAEAPATRPSEVQARDSTVSVFGPEQPATRIEVYASHELEVTRLAMSPGGMLNVAGEVTDGCYTGPQTGRTRTIGFRIVASE